MALLQSAMLPLTGEKLGRLDLSRAFTKSCRKSDFTGGFYPAMRMEIEHLTDIYQNYRSEKVQMGGVKQFF